MLPCAHSGRGRPSRGVPCPVRPGLVCRSLIASGRDWTRRQEIIVSDVEEWKPGQDTQAVATARLQEQDPEKIHCPAWGVIGNLGDSICYAGVPAKVEAIQSELRRRVVGADLPVRVIAPSF